MLFFSRTKSSTITMLVPSRQALLVVLVCFLILHEISASGKKRKGVLRQRRCRYVKSSGTCSDIIPPRLRKLKGAQYAHCRIGRCQTIQGECLSKEAKNGKTKCECIIGKRRIL